MSRWRVPGICLALAAMTFAVFGQTLWHEFINFDDGDYVYENPMVARGLTFKGFLWAFSFHAYNWHPLTWLSHMLDCQLYGLHPGGHHLTNVLIHTATVIALFLVLRQMTGALWRSAFVAAVFAIHPLRVESVAWVAERKDVLSGLFFMLTICAYVRYARGSRVPGNSGGISMKPLCEPLSRPAATLSPQRGERAGRGAYYALVLLLFALGLMSKPMLVTLPLVLLLLDYWPLRREEAAGRLVLEKLPLFALSAAACVATLLAQNSVLQPTAAVSLPLRFANGLLACVIYLRQMAYPAGLASYYPYPTGGLPSGEVALAGALLIGLSLTALWQRRKLPWLLVGWFWYLVMLPPVVGIIQVGGQAHADRYTYLPQIGIYLAVTWLLARWVAKWPATGLMAAVIAVLMACAWKQTTYWKNSETLWTRSLACTAHNETARYGLGNVFLKKRSMDEAITQYQEALQIKPNYAEAENNLGIALLGKGRADDAIAHYQRALLIDPDSAQAHYNLASALLKKGKPTDAISHFQLALQANPNYSAAHYNLGLALLQLGKADEAITHFQMALQIDPDSAETYNNLGNALVQKGSLDEGIANFRKALQIEPGSAAPHLNLGVALFQKGHLDDAIDHFRKALQIKPGYASAHYNLGNALQQKGKMAEAISHYQEALKINPTDPEVQNNIAWLLATCEEASLRNGNKAVELARQADALSGGENPLILHTLAAAFAEAGQFADARRTAQKAIELAQKAAQQDLVEQLNGELKRYEAGLPVRQ